MAQPKKDTELSAIHKATCASIVLALKGEPLVASDGTVVRHPDGSVVMIPPKAATIRAATEFLKQHDIDEEPTEGSSIMQVAKAARQWEDQPDPFLLDSK